jgi:ankyrin repeat protein
MAARADKDSQNEFGDTALIIASRNGDAKTVRVLLDAGASTKLRNQDRATAADIATARDFDQVLALLRR